MEASGGPWTTRRPYIIGTHCCNGQLGLEVYLAQFSATQRCGALNGSITNGSLRPNGYLAVTASSVRESAFTSLRARFRLTWTRYAPLSAPQYQKSKFAFKVANDLQSTCSRLPRLQLSQGRPNLFQLPACLLGLYDLQWLLYQRTHA
jgi:hypothetical protein